MQQRASTNEEILEKIYCNAKQNLVRNDVRFHKYILLSQILISDGGNKKWWQQEVVVMNNNGKKLAQGHKWKQRTTQVRHKYDTSTTQYDTSTETTMLGTPTHLYFFVLRDS